MDLIDSRIPYTALVGVVAMLRLVELGLSARNIRRLRAAGAVEVGESHYPWMVALHSGWLMSCALEPWLFARPWLPTLGYPMLAALAVGFGLRYWVIKTLGERWCTRVMYLPGSELCTDGPYRWLRHPNYLGVLLELFALPLVHTAWLTALVFGLASIPMMRARIAVEEQALRSSCDYDALLGNRRRLIPGRR